MRAAFFGGFVIAFVVGFVGLAERRADHWRPILSDIAKRSGNGPIKSVRVLPFKGCGWSLGETVYATGTIGDVPADFTMCRSRHGVRFDITTYERRWIRPPETEQQRLRRVERSGR